MDGLFPMMYFQDNNFFPFAIDWKEQSDGRTVVPGLGIYFLDPREGKWSIDQVVRQMNVSRELGMGHCFFRTKFLLDNVKGIYDFTCRFNHMPALVPPMTWAGQLAPTEPAELALKGNTLSWQAAKDRSDAPYLSYNICPCYYKRSLVSIIAQHYQLFGFRGLTAAITADKHTVKIDACAQSTAAAGSQVPVDGVSIIGEYATLRLSPQFTARSVENLEFHIH